jgi:bifunctional non-homologous end joining protein LigD
MPSFVQAQVIHSEEHGRDVAFVRVDDLDALLYVINSGCIPLHVLASRFSSLGRCDFLTVDFDLGEAPLASAVVLARALRTLLDEVGLRGYPKTSGQTGLHVLVPMGGATFTTAKQLATLLGSLLHARHPEISTIERSRRARRPGAVYIDTGQTGRSRAIVAPYSARAYAGATVSTPLHWDEVGQALAPSRFDLSTVPARVAELGDPMASMLDEAPDIDEAVSRLEPLIAQLPKARR